MERFTDLYRENVAYMERRLRTRESFDLISRRLIVGHDELTLFYIDGFVKDVVMQKLMTYFLSLKGTGDATHFADAHIPYVEVDLTESPDSFALFVLSGAVGVLGSAFGGRAIIIDARTYPARNTEEPSDDRVMQGAKDGFVETLIFNTALIRRRLRDERLTMVYKNVGKSSKTDVVICYMDGLCDKKYLKALSRRLDEIQVDALPLGSQSLIESLIRRRWYNPFPKVRTIERPDAAAAELLEGRILILCDTSPRVLVLPTAIFDFLQETDDFYFPPLTGNYLRVLRHAVFWLSLFLTPLFYLATRYRALIPPWLEFAIPAADAAGMLPVILQIFLVEIAVDGLQLASMNTPDMLTNSLSVIGGLILGEFAVEVGWLSPHVILYMAFTSIASFTQQNQELGYAFKFLRMALLALSALFGLWGFAAGLALLPILLATNRTLNGKYSYLYPLIPWNGRALARLLFRLPKSRK